MTDTGAENDPFFLRFRYWDEWKKVEVILQQLRLMAQLADLFLSQHEEKLPKLTLYLPLRVHSILLMVYPVPVNKISPDINNTFRYATKFLTVFV